MNAAQQALEDPQPAVDPWRAVPELTLLGRTAVFLFLAGFGLALGLNLLWMDDLQSFATENVLPHRNVWLLFAQCGATGLGFVAVPGLYWSVRRTRDAAAQVHRFASLLLPLAVAFMVPLFTQPPLWKGKDLLFCLTVVIWGLVLERSLRVAIQAWPQTHLTEDLRLLAPRLMRWAPRIILGLMTAGFFAYMSYYTVLRHLQLETRSYDLGVYDNTFWNLLRGEWFYSSPCLGMRGSQLMYHATFTAYLLLPFYALYQHAETLLVLQVAVCTLAALPLYGLVRHRLGSPWMALAFVAAYFLYAPAHGAIFYDIHFLTMSPFYVIMTLYFFEVRAKKGLWIALALALLNREDIGIGLSAAFLFYLISGERPGAAVVGGVVSMTYVVLAKFWLMPLHENSQADTFIYAFKAFATEDANNYAGVIRTWFTNPYFFAENILTVEKLTYLLIVLGPVLLIPLRDPRTWLLLIFGALNTVFSVGYAPLLATSFQYTAGWTGYIFVASAIVLSFLRHEPRGRVRMAAATVAMLAASVMMSHNFGAFVHDNGFRGGFWKMSWELTETNRSELEDLRYLAAKVPQDASLTVTERELPHVSNRRDCFTLRNHIRGHYGSDYVLLRTSDCRHGAAKGVMTQVIQSGEYGHVETRGPFQLWKKGADQGGNAAAARALGIPLRPGR